MGRPTANPSPNNPNISGQPPPSPPQFHQPPPPPSPPQFHQPPPQLYHQEQVTSDHDALKTSHDVDDASSSSSSSDHDDDDHRQQEMAPSDPPPPPPLPQQAYPPNPSPQQAYPPNPPPQQAYPPNPSPQNPQPNAFQQYPPQKNGFQAATYPPQGKQQPQDYPPQPNTQGPVQYPPPQPQEPVQYPPPVNNSHAAHTPQHQSYKANVSVGVPMPVGTEAFSSDLFACMDDPESAILTAFCPCMTFGQIAEILDNGQTSCATSGSLYGVVALTLMPCLVASPYRQKLRMRYNLMESPLPDWLSHWLFPWCSLCQEYRELQHRGFEPSIGWEGNLVRAQMMQQQQSGMAAPANQVMSGL